MLPKLCKWCCFLIVVCKHPFHVLTQVNNLHLRAFPELPGVPFTASPTHSLYLFVPGKTARNKCTLTRYMCTL